ncbi:MAG: WD40 repeat domain-containing protein [Bacteroidales bacterium]|nr:WD40 repeat domain-containing protein [Bacteroidales bacterium]
MKYRLIIIYIFITCFFCYCQEKDTKPYRVLKGHKHKVQNAFFSPNGKFLISHGWDNTVRVWDVKTFSQLKVLKGHTDQVWCATVSHDNNLIASGSMDRSFIIWNLKTGEMKQKIHLTPYNAFSKGIIYELDGELPNSVYSLSFNSDGKFLAVASADKLVRIWDIENSIFLDTLSGHNTNWMWVCYSLDGKHIISGSRNNASIMGETIIWETKSYNQIRKINMTGDILFTDNNELGIYKGDCSMDYYDLSNGKLVSNKPFPCFEGNFNISIDKKYIASCNEDYCIRLWDLQTQEVIWKYKGEKKEIQQANFSPNGKYLIAGTPESDILVWKITSLIKK